MKLKVKVTKDILERSKMCGTKHYPLMTGKGCAIALALCDVFGEVVVGHQVVFYGAYEKNPSKPLQLVLLPSEAATFIHKFDGFVNYPERRLEMPEFEFEIDVPEVVIDSIGIEEITELLSSSKTLELA